MAYRDPDEDIIALLRRGDPAAAARPLSSADLDGLRRTALASFSLAQMSSAFRFRRSLVAGVAAIAFLAVSLSYQLGRNAALEERVRSQDVGNATTLDAHLVEQQIAAALVQPLSSANPYERQTALLVGHALGLESMRKIAETRALTERNREARLSAESLLLDGPDAIGALQRLSSKRLLRIELLRSDLKQLRSDAEGYARGGTPSGAVEAVQLYNRLLEQLSPESRKGLDSGSLAAAHVDAGRGDMDRAALRFMTLFASAAGEDDALDSTSR
jgi:hypothetical protein